MKDKWKEFIEDHRDDFETESPRDRFHENVIPHLKNEKSPRMIRLSVFIQMAASIAVIFGVTLYFVLNRQVEKSTSVSVPAQKTENERLVLAKVNPELAETEFYYVSQIDELMEQVENKELTPEIKLLLEQLDKEFEILKKEMGENVNSNQIVEALIENYRLKIKLLEKILNAYDSNQDQHEKEINT